MKPRTRHTTLRTATFILAAAVYTSAPPAVAGLPATSPVPLTPTAATVAARAALAARQAAEAEARARAQAQIDYYKTTYPGEVGPFNTFKEASNSAITAVNNTARYDLDADLVPSPYIAEWGSTIYVDPYGKWWRTVPYRGRLNRDQNRWETMTGQPTVPRPRATFAGSAHSHVLNSGHQDLFVDNPSGDNLTGAPQFVIIPQSVSLGGPWLGVTRVWYIKPNEHKGNYVQTCLSDDVCHDMYPDDDVRNLPPPSTPLHNPGPPSSTGSSSSGPSCVEVWDRPDGTSTLYCNGSQPSANTAPIMDPFGSGEVIGILILTGEEPPYDTGY